MMQKAMFLCWQNTFSGVRNTKNKWLAVSVYVCVCVCMSVCVCIYEYVGVGVYVCESV